MYIFTASDKDNAGDNLKSRLQSYEESLVGSTSPNAREASKLKLMEKWAKHAAEKEIEEDIKKKQEMELVLKELDRNIQKKREEKEIAILQKLIKSDCIEDLDVKTLTIKEDKSLEKCKQDAERDDILISKSVGVSCSNNYVCRIK